MNFRVNENADPMFESYMIMGGASLDLDDERPSINKTRIVVSDDVFWQAPHVLHEWSTAEITMECSSQD